MTEHNRPFTAHSFEKYLEEGKLMGSRCPRCQEIYLPVRSICPSCLGTELEWVECSGQGRLAAFTAVHIGPTFMNEEGFGRDNPYLTGIVELEEGVRISARLLGLDPRLPDQIELGIPVQVEIIQIGPEEDRKPQLAFKAVNA